MNNTYDIIKLVYCQFALKHPVKMSFGIQETQTMSFSKYDKSIFYSAFPEELSLKIVNFITNIWGSPADYIVLMARRMFNLNYVLYNLEDFEQQEESRNRIMSNTAILCKAPEIAAYYVRAREFPKILICDDILVHGRGIMKLITALESVIYDCVQMQESIEKEQIHRDLIKAINIYVFARNEKGVLVDSSYSILAEQIVSKKVSNRLSFYISRFLYKCSIANSSFVLSLSIPSHLLYGLDLSDPALDYNYQNRRLTLYYKTESNVAIRTIRINRWEDSPRHDGTATSLVLFGDMDVEHFNDLANRIARYVEMSVGKDSKISKILRFDSEFLQKPKAQLISFIYSLLNFIDFGREKLDANDNMLFDLFLQSDYKKISMNFDNGEGFQYEIYLLFRSICENEGVSVVLWVLLSMYSSGIIHNSIKVTEFTRGNYRNRTINPYERAEDIIYKVGTESEFDAYKSYLNNNSFKKDQIGFDIISLYNYLSIMEGENIDDVTSVGSVFGLMDAGLLSMNVELKKGGQRTIRNILKAGELSTSVLPFRFSVFVPALAFIERQSRRNQFNTRNIVKGYIEYVQDYCYSSQGAINRTDMELLMRVEQCKNSLLDLYSIGQSFEEWDFDIDDDSWFINSKNLDELTHDERKRRQNHYLYYARKYINLINQYMRKNNETEFSDK